MTADLILAVSYNRNFIRMDDVEIFESNKPKFNIFGAHGDDDLIMNYSFQVGGYNFLEPRFYFSRKNKPAVKITIKKH